VWPQVAEKRRMKDVTCEGLIDAFGLIETLIPGFYPNMDSMKAADWVRSTTPNTQTPCTIAPPCSHHQRIMISGLCSSRPANGHAPPASEKGPVFKRPDRRPT
jgi:hypothetical protein